MSKYTEGPWSIAFTFNIIGADGRRGVANTGGYSENRNQEACHEENIANASLIAAAPELLDALRRLLATINPGNADSHSKDCGCVIHEARAAIAKAEAAA